MASRQLLMMIHNNHDKNPWTPQQHDKVTSKMPEWSICVLRWASVGLFIYFYLFILSIHRVDSPFSTKHKGSGSAIIRRWFLTKMWAYTCQVNNSKGAGVAQWIDRPSIRNRGSVVRLLSNRNLTADLRPSLSRCRLVPVEIFRPSDRA